MFRPKSIEQRSPVLTNLRQVSVPSPSPTSNRLYHGSIDKKPPANSNTTSLHHSIPHGPFALQFLTTTASTFSLAILGWARQLSPLTHPSVSTISQRILSVIHLHCTRHFFFSQSRLPRPLHSYDPHYTIQYNKFSQITYTTLLTKPFPHTCRRCGLTVSIETRRESSEKKSLSGGE